MSRTKMNTDRKKWQALMTTHAEQLETQANAARLLAMTETPLDGIAVAWDLAMATFHNHAARTAREHGEPAPTAPAPVSRLLTGFADAVREKLISVGVALRDDERTRLAAIAPRVLASVEAQDKPVIETIAALIPLPPEWIALWLRAHLDEIEARFAS
jgi:hypothetical protein